MSSPKNLLKATLNLLSGRIRKKLFKVADDINFLAKDIPEQFQKEWILFEKEVFEEAKRLEKESNQYQEDLTPKQDLSNHETPLEKIDRLREKVAQLNRKVESKY